MSTSSVYTKYIISMSGIGGGSIDLTTLDDPWTDAFMESLGAALKTLAWPIGTSFEIQKHAMSDGFYELDQTVTPMVFG